MATRYEGASVRPQALVVSPEAPYPPVGGGATRTASLIDYLAKRYNIDVITFRECPGDVRTFPANRVRNTLVLDLPPHSKALASRASRNLGRFLAGRPPLVDRFSGFGNRIREWMGDRVYGIVLIEHFWCAPYAEILRQHSERMVLDLHNVESALQSSSAQSEQWPLSAMFLRFGRAYADLERQWLPQFDDLLVTSTEDAERVRVAAPAARLIVYPNAIPKVEQPGIESAEAIAFSGNLEYHPNVSAVRWFGQNVWPVLRQRHPALEWRLIGKNPHAVPLSLPGMNIVGPVDDAIEALARTKLSVVPLFSGSGTRFKILEAWAAGRPVVSTSLGAEGLGARDGKELLIADDAGSFTAAIESLLENQDLAAELGANGRRLYLDRFTTEAAWRILDGKGF